LVWLVSYLARLSTDAYSASRAAACAAYVNTLPKGAQQQRILIVPRKIRNSKHRGALDSSALAWLRGHHNTGSFFKFKPDDELEALWLEHGDTETMF
jgi:hypothetical protein